MWRHSRAALSLASALLTAGCFTSADGRQPPADELFFPTGLVVSPGANTLYVANSDFDLQYAGGSVLAMDLVKLREAVLPIVEAISAGETTTAACESVGLTNNPDLWLNPGPCSAFALEPYVRNHAFIGAFASGLLLVHDPEGPGARLFVPVRGDPSITYFDVQDDRPSGGTVTPSYQLDCDRGEDGFCADEFRIGQDRDLNLRGIQLPADPVGIAATADGRAIVSAHQTQASASLVVNDWSAVPYLSYFASNLASGPTEVVTIPQPAMVEPARDAAESLGEVFSYQPGFALTYRSTSEIDILRYYDDSGASPSRPFINRTSITPIILTSTNYDSRGMAVIDTARRTCEEQCTTTTTEVDCLTQCAEEYPLQAFVASRNPAALLLGQIETVVDVASVQSEPELVYTGATEEMYFYSSVPLNFGPSRVETGSIINRDGELEERVFVVCFDSRMIFSYDPVLQRIDNVIATGRGPHDIAVDTGSDDNGTYSFLYVGHFTDSYIGVVDLDMRRPLTFGQMFASIGSPTPPTESR